MLDELDRKTIVQKGGTIYQKQQQSQQQSQQEQQQSQQQEQQQQQQQQSQQQEQQQQQQQQPQQEQQQPQQDQQQHQQPQQQQQQQQQQEQQQPQQEQQQQQENETYYLKSNRIYRWFVSLLKGICKWIIGLFTGAFNEKFEELKKEFSIERLLGRFDAQQLKTIENDLTGHIGNIQRLVATGIGGAASASIDMLLNAFSMSPVFGTTILVWRMFQNMLMIMGASLSVQAANNTFSTNIAKKADQTGGGVKDKDKVKNNITTRLKTDIRQLNRSLKRYMQFPHRKSMTIINGPGSGYNYT
jgi:flagellar biosynthesis GTPase FlhF